MSQREFDVIVIGAGPSGEVAAAELADGRLEVALVERDLVGGECAYYACMPSKALLRPAQALAEARRVPGAAQAVNGALDVQAVLARRDEVVHELDDSAQLGWMRERGIELFRGAAVITAEREVSVGEHVLTARRAVVIATGSSAALPPIEGLSTAAPWTSHEATVAERVPERLAVLGGGVVGVEMAQAYATLGSRVTLIEPESRILGREEPFVSTQVTDALTDAGAIVLTGVGAESVSRRKGALTVTLADADEVVADELLVATGRAPNTVGLGLERFDLAESETLDTDETLRVRRHDWLYAIGDVNGRVLLTHMAKHQAKVACTSILGEPSRRLRSRGDGDQSPRVVFTEPQVAAVGHTQASARDAGIEIRVATAETAANAAGSFYGKDSVGTAMLVVDDARDVIVGATFTGVDVQDLLHAATIAVVAEIPIAELRYCVPAFPTRSEVWLALLE